jgi:hypothetical protein
MTGLLHRLAARAAGNTVAVRSDARLPFRGIGPGPGAAASVPEPLSTFAPRAPALTRPPAAALDRPHVDPAASIVTPAASRPEVFRADPNSPTADARRDSRASCQNVVPPGRDATVPPRMVDPDVDKGRQTASRAEWAGRSAAPLAPDAAGHDGVLRLPPLLVPLAMSDGAPVSAAVASTVVPTVPAAAQNAARAESTEVHIHIGSIEVTAVHEAPAPQQRPLPAPPPMSLDTYLAKRGRE